MFRGRRVSLASAIDFEMSRQSGVVAAEPLTNHKTAIEFPHVPDVGLVVKNAAIVKTHRRDVCSEYRPDGGLRRCRDWNDACSQHREAWARPQYVAIAVNGRIGKKTWATVQAKARKYGLPIVRIGDRVSNSQRAKKQIPTQKICFGKGGLP
jgi:hypothetical protein